jgi:hypothetical protein
MDDNGLPCLDMLEATPTILRGLMAELTEEDVRWKPAPDRFSASATRWTCPASLAGPDSASPPVTGTAPAAPSTRHLGGRSTV